MLLGKAEGVVTLDISDLSTKVGMATSQLGMLDSAAGRFDNLDAQLRSVGTSTDRLGTGFVALGSAMLAPMAIGLKGAIDLEQSMKNVEVALGDVSNHDFQKLSNQIIEIGASGEFSAREIAVVSEELAKAGYTIDDIMSGDPAAGFGNMAQAVSDLASATGDGLGPAVQGIVVAMSTWKPEIVGVDKAITDATRAADIFTIAANESTAGVTDIISGMRNFGPTAALMGVGFDEAAAAIATFTNYGLTAREAGTSLTRALTVLADPTSEAAELMTELGISAFDMEGNFVGLPSLMSQLNENMKGMSQEARLAALSTIFGAEAMDVMGLAVLGAGEDVEALLDIMAGGDGFVSAADQARERTNTLAGALERLSEVSMTALAVLAQGLIGPIRFIAEGLDRLISAFVALPKPVTTAIGLVITSIGLLFVATGSFLLMGPRIIQFMQTARAMSQLPGILGRGASAFLAFGRAIRFMLLAGTGIGVLVGAIAALVRLDLFGFGAAWERAADAFHQANDAGSMVVGVLNAIAAALRSFDIGPLNTVADVLTGLGTGWMAFWGGFNKGADAGTKQLQDAIDMSGILINQIEDASGADGFRYLLMETNVDTGELEEVGEVLESHDDPNDASRWWARIMVDGKEYEAYIDKETGAVTHIPVEVEVTNPDVVPSLMDRIANGFIRIRDAGKTMRMDWLEDFGQFGLDAVESINMAHAAFDVLRASGVNPVSAALRSMAVAFEEMGWDRAAGIVGGMGRALESIPFGAIRDRVVDLANDGFGRLQRVAGNVWDEVSKGGRRAWNRFTDGVEDAMGTVRFATNVFSNLVDAGMHPVEAGLRTLGTVFPGLRGPINSAISGFRTVTDTFRRFRSEGLNPLRAGIATVSTLFDSIDWGSIGARIMDGLRSAFTGIGDVLRDLGSSILDGLTGISDSLGNWIADLFDTDEGSVGGGTKGTFGHAITDKMRDDLEQAAKGAWERAWDNFRTWVSGRVEAIGDWVLDTGVPTVSGWLATAGGAVWDALKELAGWAWDQRADLGTITLSIAGWAITTGRSILDAVRTKINSWLFGGSTAGAGSLTGAAASGGGTIDIGTVGAEITDWAIIGTEDLREKVDEKIEDALGETFVFTVNLALDFAFQLVEDPFGTIKNTLIVLGGIALASLLITGGVTTALTLLGIVGLAALGYYIVTQIMDYFDRNPLVLERLQVRIGELWTELKESDLGWFFSGIEGLYNILSAVVSDLVEFHNWLTGLPGPLGAATRAVDALVIALTALSAIAFIGGMGGKSSGRNIGFIGGLLRGLWNIASFPFRLIFKPIQTLKGLLDIGGKGSRGGRGALGFLETLQGVIRLPFRVASLGIRSIGNAFKMLISPIVGATNAFKVFRTGYDRAIKAFKVANFNALGGKQYQVFTKTLNDVAVTWTQRLAAMRRGLNGLFMDMIQGRSPIRVFARGMVGALSVIDPIYRAFSRLTHRLFESLSSLFVRLPRMLAGDDIAKAFRSAAPGLRQALWQVFNVALLGLPGLLRRAVRKMMDRVFSESVGSSLASRLFSAIRNAIDRFLMGGFRPSKGIIAGFFGGLFSALTAIPSLALRGFGKAIVLGAEYLAKLFWTTLSRAFGIDRAAALFSALGRVRQAIVSFFTPRGLGIIADPKAFQAFNVLGDMFDNVAKRAGALKKVGGFFDDIGHGVIRMVKPLSGVSSHFGSILRVASRLSPALRAIGVAFTFFGIEQMIGKLGGLSGIFSKIKDAWLDLSEVFSRGGMREVVSVLAQELWDGLKQIPGIIRDAISGLQDMGISGIWDWIKESASNIDWKIVGTIIITGLTLMVAGIPGILLGLVGVFLWEWLYDSLDGFDWGSLGSRLLSGLQTAFSTVMGWLGSLGSLLASAIGGAWNWLREKGIELLQSLVDGLNAGVGMVTSWLGLLGSIVLAALGGAWDWLREKGGQLMQSLVDGLNDGVGMVTAWLGLLGSVVLAALGGVWDWLKPKGVELLQSAVDGFNEGVTRVTAWLGQLVDIVMAALGLGGVWDWLKPKGAELLQSLANGFEIGFEAASAWLGSLAEKLQGLVEGGWDWLQEKGTELLQGLYNGLSEGWGMVRDFVRGIPNAIVGLIPDVSDLLTDVGSDLWDGLKGGFETAFNAAESFFTGIGDTIKGWIGTVASWFGLGGDDSVSAEDLIDIDLNELATQIDAALAAAFRARGTGGELAVALSEYLQEQVQAAFMDIQLNEGITLGHQIAEAIDSEITKGIGVLSGDSLSSALTEWFNRGTAKLSTSLTTTFQNLRETIDTAVTTDIGAMSGESLATALQLWFIRATASLFPKMTTTFQGIRTMIDTAVATDIGVMSGDSLANALMGWFMKAIALMISLLPTSVMGLRNAINAAVVADIGLMDGTSLGGAIAGWFDRGIGMAIPLITTALQSITMAFTSMVNQTLALMGAWSTGVGNIATSTMGQMAGTIATANASSTTSFESFVNTTIALMGAWYQGVTNIVTNAMSEVRDTISSGSAQALSAIQRNFTAIEDAVRSSMRNASSAIRSEASTWAGIIDGFYYSMFAAGQRVGMAAGEGVASGLRSKLDEVRAAAREIVSVVMMAMEAAAELGSPSKITTYYGEMIGMGPVVGIERMIPKVAAISERYMGTALGIFDRFGRRYDWAAGRSYAPIRQNTGSTTTINVTMNNDYTITQQPGQDGEALSRDIVRHITRSFDAVIGEG